ncbi:MAG: 3-hydroxyacyl-CoA dehydrogenase/enoyl-CoA hydratase family protein [Polaromonas sp.]|uniref:3-hydroxyacyl-CoA dehydrogenase/enoyl-CoA hydratase family protein n=1 Tax=Polaromonas sp. TaxID=1869339 RepID=UPI002730ACC8|nr:3-hydroxyacyl-CoA dehydrogenase/enoyl-CoA hydratase family protein [Polaromonas sp.]MDP2450398.1 3-hydroxyacyl-CoA dehydrogenase/enoyl-CoA hydratase family protein [Polaromonas sp.]MDP3246799.1 3-hydroxyacyl-CoA dehydrogenase/enoyl-CoA hydratase family protein [Polaromonas sp.]MDP3758021.1 3-hydroxyacyl-CoA dehydrogenase/enoyl-CoA hydratase family protein [Polaromonas sp.]
MSRFQVKKVAVLGAGVMGAQIAAHLVNLKVPVVLFDLPAKEGPKNGIVSRAIEGLKKLKPAPLGVPEDAALIQQANYEEHMDVLKECDLIIEAIAERMDWKTDLYHKIAPFIGEGAIVASNTSGLSITKLSEALPESIKPRFCGIHFFNPPRYMTLVELINTPTTDPRVLDDLEAFVTSGLGKGVIRAHDTPNFVANRVGIAGMLATMKEVENFGLTYDVVDDLTGKKLGRASSGTFRTADVVGLDTMAHVIKTLQDNLDEKSDPFYASFGTPDVLKKLLELGNLGQKSQAGFYKKVGRDILRFELESGEYVPGGQKADEVYTRMLKRPAAERLRLLRNAEGPQGQFLWAILRNSFHYAAVHLASIADNARDVDQAMRWGFGMKQGPFELWQEAGWLAVATMIQEDIDAGKALCKAPLPEWVFKGPVAEAGGVHTAQGSWSASAGQFVARRALPVYDRQYFPEKLLGEALPDFMTAGTTLHEDDAIRLWTLAGEQGDVLIASIKTKMHAISPDVVEGLAMGVDLAEKSYKGLVIWSNDEMFSAGADLQAMLPAFMMAGVSAVEGAEAEMQNVMLKLRYAAVPVVSAVRGLALGGGCELAVYSSKRVAAMESYIGLVEVGVGLVPGAGGLTYIARRAAENAASSTSKDMLPFLTEGFTAAAMAKVGTSAIESRKIGYLLDSDVIVPHKDELLFVALNEARALFNSGYRAPHKRPFPVVGRSGLATIKGQLVNMRDGGFISAHDFHIASLIANVVCGGDVDAGSLVTEEYVMTLERKAFCALLEHPKTQERIMGMMSTGKPVRN